MTNVSIGFGLALIALGLWGYVTAQTPSPTALIPAAFGIVLLACGLIARDPAKRKTSMHVAVVFAAFGFAGGMRGLPGLYDMITGNPVERPHAVIAQSILLLLCGIYTLLCVRSFIAARKARGLA